MLRQQYDLLLKGEPEHLAERLKNNPELIKQKDENGNTLLHYCPFLDVTAELG